MTVNQKTFMDMVLGTLIYTVVLGFLNDYTSLIHTETYSVTFGLAIVMQLLTHLTFAAKDRIVTRLKRKSDPNKFAIAVSVWLVMFFSKFVFLWMIELLFRQYVQVSGFISLLIIIATMTVASSVISYVYKKLE